MCESSEAHERAGRVKGTQYDMWGEQGRVSVRLLHADHARTRCYCIIRRDHKSFVQFGFFDDLGG